MTTPAAVPLNIIIIGGGITGLFTSICFARTGHTVTIFESARTLTALGAGLQLAPNATRLLTTHSLLHPLLPSTTEPTHITSLRRNGTKISTTSCANIRTLYNAPLLVVHRADLQTVLLKAAKEAGVRIHTGVKVERVHRGFEARVLLAGGEWVGADLVVAADGIRSRVRGQLGVDEGPRATGDAAYRVLVKREDMAGDIEALKLLDSGAAMRWMGEGRHIMAYPLRNQGVLNMVLLHPARTSDGEGSWTERGSKEEMVKEFEGWDPVIGRLLRSVPDGEVLRWKLHTHAPLPTWHRGCVVLLGDACHPMLPYVAQGAAQGLEDGAALATALGLMSGKEEVGRALEVYESVRKERAERIQASADATQKALHLPDGVEQRKRDRLMKLAGDKAARNPDMWNDDGWQRFMWGHDVVEETAKEWERRRARGLGTKL